MIKPELIQSLKKNNVSINSEKTKERLRAVWAPLSRPKRNMILELADMKEVTIQRAYKSGGVSAKVVIAMAQVLQIDPRWLTGETNDKGTFDTDQAVKFLKKLGYDVGKNDVSRSKVSYEPKEETITVTETKPQTKLKAVPIKETSSRADKLSVEDVVLLVRGLTIQATYSAEKNKTLTQIKDLLLQ